MSCCDVSEFWNGGKKRCSLPPGYGKLMCVFRNHSAGKHDRQPFPPLLLYPLYYCFVHLDSSEVVQQVHF